MAVVFFGNDVYSIQLDPSKDELTDDQRSKLLANIQLLRDAIVLFTATGMTGSVFTQCFFL